MLTEILRLDETALLAVFYDRLPALLVLGEFGHVLLLVVRSGGVYGNSFQLGIMVLVDRLHITRSERFQFGELPSA